MQTAPYLDRVSVYHSTNWRKIDISWIVREESERLEEFLFRIKCNYDNDEHNSTIYIDLYCIYKRVWEQCFFVLKDNTTAFMSLGKLLDDRVISENSSVGWLQVGAGARCDIIFYYHEKLASLCNLLWFMIMAYTHNTEPGMMGYCTHCSTGNGVVNERNLLLTSGPGGEMDLNPISPRPLSLSLSYPCVVCTVYSIIYNFILPSPVPVPFPIPSPVQCEWAITVDISSYS